MTNEELNLRKYILKEWVDTGFIQVFKWKSFINHLKIWRNKQIEAKTKEIFQEFKDKDEVFKHIKECEGKHKQQIAYSSYHDALTQVCFDCGVVRTNLKIKGVKK
jgi:hypothetical protein